MDEDPENLVQEYEGMDEDSINDAIADTCAGVYVLKEQASSAEGKDIGVVLEGKDIGVVLEGIMVLQNLENVAMAVAMLFGLMYALNLSYPQNLRYMFEVLQKIIMELNEGELSNKVRALKNRLFQRQDQRPRTVSSVFRHSPQRVLCPHLPVVLVFHR
uniref:Uncharacterized protein n=1 Tax=Oryzias latipes TaxID=8090 RepID=A0A3B3H3E1_ORYLA